MKFSSELIYEWVMKPNDSPPPSNDEFDGIDAPPNLHIKSLFFNLKKNNYSVKLIDNTGVESQLNLIQSSNKW